MKPTCLRRRLRPIALPLAISGWLLLPLLVACQEQLPEQDTSAAMVWLFAQDGEMKLEQAKRARQRLAWDEAERLLAETLKLDPTLEAASLHERGKVAQERGDFELARSYYSKAADMDPTLDARVDQAGVLVLLGRWPEAIVILSQAFDERGPALQLEGVVKDKRFVKLAELVPYQEMIARVQTEQQGSLGRVLIRLERMASQLKIVERSAQRLASWFHVLRSLLNSTGLGVLVLFAMASLLSIAWLQVGMGQTWWRFWAALVVCSGLWLLVGHYLLARLLGSAVVVASAWAAALLSTAAIRSGRWLVTQWRLRRIGAADPFSQEHLPATLLMVDELSRLGHRSLGARRQDQKVLQEAMRQAAENLRERLERGLPG